MFVFFTATKTHTHTQGPLWACTDPDPMFSHDSVNKRKPKTNHGIQIFSDVSDFKDQSHEGKSMKELPLTMKPTIAHLSLSQTYLSHIQVKSKNIYLSNLKSTKQR